MQVDGGSGKPQQLASVIQRMRVHAGMALYLAALHVCCVFCYGQHSDAADAHQMFVGGQMDVVVLCGAVS